MKRVAPKLTDYANFRELVTVRWGHSQEIFDLLTEPGETGTGGAKHILDLVNSDPAVLMGLGIPKEIADNLLSSAKLYYKNKKKLI